MLSLVRQSFPSGKAFFFLSFLFLINIVVWTFAATFFSLYSSKMLSYLIIAYSLGLRHALDWDHIAAIDNVTRRFVQLGQTPVTIGFFFSLGHSSIVIIATFLVAALSSSIMETFDSFGSVTGIIGPSISASFLFLIGFINAFSIYYIIKSLKQLRNKEEVDNNQVKDLDELIQTGGFFTRIFGNCLFKVIDKTWKMYFVGFLFGLGFDTSTEISLLAIAYIQSQNGLSTWLILFLAVMFTCGMTLVDTIDAIIMLNVYGWASVSAEQKLHYNLIITTMSFLFAIIVAILQVFGIFQEVYELEDDEF